MRKNLSAVLLAFPPRPLAPHECDLVTEWLGLALDIPSAYVSNRRSDDPAIYQRIVVSTTPDARPTYLIHSPSGMHMWVKLSVEQSRTEMFDSLSAALNSIRHVLDATAIAEPRRPSRKSA